MPLICLGKTRRVTRTSETIIPIFESVPITYCNLRIISSSLISFQDEFEFPAATNTCTLRYYAVSIKFATFRNIVNLLLRNVPVQTQYGTRQRNFLIHEEMYFQIYPRFRQLSKTKNFRVMHEMLAHDLAPKALCSYSSLDARSRCTCIRVSIYRLSIVATMW